MIKQAPQGLQSPLHGLRKAWDARDFVLEAKDREIERLKAQLEAAGRGRKRKAIPNPNRRFQTLADLLGGGLEEPQNLEANEASGSEEDAVEVDDDDDENEAAEEFV